jgi:hypothetical protein
MFSPSPAQQRFRAIAHRLHMEDDEAAQEEPAHRRRWRLSDWCRAAALEGLTVSPRDYLDWEQDDEFRAWWWETQPAYAPVTQAEVLYADRALFESVVDGIADPAMARVYAALKATKTVDKGSGMSDEMRDMLDHLARMSSGNPYLIGGGGVVGEAK